MAKQTTIKTLFSFLEEVDRGARDKSRTTNSITDFEVKEIVKRGTASAISSGFAAGGFAAGTAVVTGMTSGIVSGVAGTGSAAAFAAAGAAAGSAVPVVGTIIGAGVGLIFGGLIGRSIKNKNENEKQRLNQEVMRKQNGIINQLRKEKEDLEKEYNRTQEQNERYKYIIGILMSFDDLKKSCA